MTENPTLPSTVTDPLTGLDYNDIVTFARELARGMFSADVVCEECGITDKQFEALKDNPAFIDLLKKYIVEWEAVGNTDQRLALQGKIGLEKVLPHLTSRCTNEREPLVEVVQGAKLLASIAGADNNAAKQGSSGEKFTITINLGDDYKLQRTVEVQSLGSGESPLPALPVKPQGS